MSSIVVSLNIIGPMFLMGLAGFVLRRVGLLNETMEAGISKLVFNAFLPVMLFVNIYSGTLEGLNGAVVVYVACVLLLMFAVYMVVVALIEKDAGTRTALIHGLLRGNSALFGIPLAAGLAGDQDISLMLITTAMVLVLYNILVPILFSVYSGKKQSLKQIVVQVITNPLLIGTLAGCFMLLFNIKLPEVVLSAAQSIAKLTTPLSFICLGSIFSLKIDKQELVRIAVSVAVRLVIAPAAILAFAVLVLGFRGLDLIVVLAIFATPPAVSTYSIARAYNANYKLAGEILTACTSLSILTLFGFIWLFTYFGLL